MRTGWLSVVAGLKREGVFRQEHGLSTGVFRHLRTEPGMELGDSPAA